MARTRKGNKVSTLKAKARATEPDPYYTLVILQADEDGHPEWQIAFGSYDIEDVRAEREMMPDEATRILKSSDDQGDIDERIAHLNGNDAPQRWR